MANGGWHGTKAEWERAETPLLLLDQVIEEHAREWDAHVTKNFKDWPERSIVWGQKEVRCLIQLYLEQEKALTFTLWLCASQDRDCKRYWKQEKTINAKIIAEFQDRLPNLLVEGRRKLMEWSDNPGTLESVTDLR